MTWLNIYFNCCFLGLEALLYCSNNLVEQDVHYGCLFPFTGRETFA